MNQDSFFENIQSLKFLAKKEVGQNFLIDQKAASNIIETLTLEKNEKVLEIGCGAGSISYFLSKKENTIDLIDIDEGLLAKVENDFANIANVHVINANAMKFDYSPYDKIVGNLPYYITSGIIEQVFLKSVKLKKAVFMVQKEAADRLLLKNGKEDITPLTLFINYVSSMRKEFNVGRNSFVPIPHVDSTVLSFSINPLRFTEETKNTYLFVKKLFLNKRKTILNNLKNAVKGLNNCEEILQTSGIDPLSRPESINFEKFIKLYSEIKKSE